MTLLQIADVIIVGAGPAGIATAIQLKRYGINPIIIEKNEIGGLLVNANLVENYPGFNEGISGIELIEKFKQHLGKAVVIKENVLDIDYPANFTVATNKNTYQSRFLVVASGTRPKKLNNLKIPDIQKLVHYDIFPLLCITDKKICIIGAGDAAFDYAINLAKNNEVRILNRKNTTKCLPLLIERIKYIKNISYTENIEVNNVEIKANYLNLFCTLADSLVINEIQCDYLLIAIGREPNLYFLKNSLINKFKDLQKENLLFVIGDVQNDIYRQTSISTGDGIMTAMKIYRKFNGETV